MAAVSTETRRATAPAGSYSVKTACCGEACRFIAKALRVPSGRSRTTGTSVRTEEAATGVAPDTSEAALAELAKAGWIDTDTRDELTRCYWFLRDVEHRLQYWDDQQTQTLPENPEQQQLLAESMGFADYAAFSDGH